MSTQTMELPLVLPADTDCDRCIARLQVELGRIRGVAGARVGNSRTELVIDYDPEVVPLHRIEAQARQVGAEIAERIEHQTLELRDLDCPDCAATIEKAVNRLPGVLWAGANFAAGQMFVEFERGRASLKDVTRVVEIHGARACPIPLGTGIQSAIAQRSGLASLWVEHRRLITVLLSAGLAVGGWALGLGGFVYPSVALYAAAIVVGGWSTARAGLMAMRARAVDMNTLMTLAVAGAAGIGDWAEGATVVVLYNAGILLQAYTVERTRRSIRGLMDLSPRMARVRRGAGEEEIPADRVRVGDVVLVRPGERIPADGKVVAGSSDVNEAPITGESAPADKSQGSVVFAGTLNGRGSLELRATHDFRETVLARIIEEVEEAQARRAPAQQLIDRFAARYTPAVIALAVGIALVPPLALALTGAVRSGAWEFWFQRSLSLLIIACPCALVISTPVAIVTAIGSASRRGALIKGGAYLEQMAGIRAVLYDKTGTLTHGRFRVSDVESFGALPAEEVLRILAAIESRSEHPLASAILSAARARGMRDLPDASDFQAIAGRGATAVVEGRRYLAGSPVYMEEAGLPTAAGGAAASGTVVLLASGDGLLGRALLEDTPRDQASGVARELRELGIAYQYMLTGDSTLAAEPVARAAGLDGFEAGLLPEQKRERVLQIQQEYGPAAMVGDGINDAPALATASVGIVMGAAGSDTAMETADIALMGDDLTRLPYLIRLSRAARRVMRQNVGFSLVTKGALLVAAIFAGIPLWLAVAGDVGVSLLVTLNALRLATNGRRCA